MFSGTVRPVEVFFYQPEAIFVNFYWPRASSSLLASSPAKYPNLIGLMTFQRQGWYVIRNHCGRDGFI